MVLAGIDGYLWVKEEGKMAGFQVKVVLEGVQPPLWRRILLPDQLSFADLHVILQIVFGWQEEHLHDFSFQRSRVRISDTEYALSLIHIFGLSE